MQTHLSDFVSVPDSVRGMGSDLRNMVGKYPILHTCIIQSKFWFIWVLLEYGCIWHWSIGGVSTSLSLIISLLPHQHCYLFSSFFLVCCTSCCVTHDTFFCLLFCLLSLLKSFPCLQVSRLTSVSWGELPKENVVPSVINCCIYLDSPQYIPQLRSDELRVLRTMHISNPIPETLYHVAILPLTREVAYFVCLSSFFIECKFNVWNIRWAY